MPKSILIVDDDKLVRKVLRSFVESRTHFEVCGEAVNGLDAIAKARTLNELFRFTSVSSLSIERPRLICVHLTFMDFCLSPLMTRDNF